MGRRSHFVYLIMRYKPERMQRYTYPHIQMIRCLKIQVTWFLPSAIAMIAVATVNVCSEFRRRI